MPSTSFKTAYTRLNKAQKKAVDTIDGPVLVVAGPGSGKTQVLTLRIANILEKTDTKASNILCLTFTDSAAHNMRERLSTFMHDEAYRVHIHTFHNLCTSIINAHPEYFYKGAQLRPADEATKYSVMQSCIESLPYDAKMRSFHPEQGYAYLRAALDTISHIKRAGLSPADFKTVLDANDQDIIRIQETLIPIISKRITEDTYQEFSKALTKLHKDFGNKHVLSYHSLIDALYYNFTTTVKEKKDFTKWKDSKVDKDDNGESVFADAKRAGLLREVLTVYTAYSTEMYRQGFYDFDDMILDVIQTLEKDISLRSKLQEQYQYVLVDEFQDTNDAQMRLIWLLTNNPVSEGRPNIMAVGDDDQAIYKFQGAELSNIMEFTRMYSGVEIIVLTENYRSNEQIVSSALSMIRTGEHRLEQMLADFTKELKANKIFDHKNRLGKKHSIEVKEFDTRLHEYAYVAKQIRHALDSGVEAEDVAVIARSHKDLISLVPYLQEKNIPVRYEREQHVLSEPHIQQLVTLVRYAVSCLESSKDELLPKIFTYPFWNIETLDIWRLSREAYEKRVSWIDVAKTFEIPAVQTATTHILEIARLATYENAEHVLDYCINKTGFRDYYFNSDKFSHEKSEYLVFLSSLRTFIQAVREYRRGKELQAKDLIHFVDTYEQNDIILSDLSPFVNARNAVHLLTAHKSKGLEFEVVCIVGATDKNWATNKGRKLITLPVNLPIAPAGDNEDDWLRLFFVALTRAKNHLYITSHRAGDDGKKTNILRFLNSIGVSVEEGDLDTEASVEKLLESAMISADRKSIHLGPKFLDTEHALLDTLTKDHILSVTHINNFLNVDEGGPMLFLENNLLRFPQAKTASAGYGTAMHAILNRSVLYLKKEKHHPKLEEVKQWYTDSLTHERLSRDDHTLYLEKGLSLLPEIYKEKILTLKGDELTEVDFRHEGVVLKDSDVYVPVSGKIDLVRFEEGGVWLCDFKTGKEKKSWTGKDAYEKVRLHANRQQLAFYKMLIERSKTYNGLHVLGGQLEFLESKGSRLGVLVAEITDEEVERLERLIVAIYKRIQAHDFTVPESVKALKGLEAVEAFEELLLGE